MTSCSAVFVRQVLIFAMFLRWKYERREDITTPITFPAILKLDGCVDTTIIIDPARRRT